MDPSRSVPFADRLPAKRTVSSRNDHKPGPYGFTSVAAAASAAIPRTASTLRHPCLRLPRLAEREQTECRNAYDPSAVEVGPESEQRNGQQQAAWSRRLVASAVEQEHERGEQQHREQLGADVGDPLQDACEREPGQRDACANRHARRFSVAASSISVAPMQTHLTAMSPVLPATRQAPANTSSASHSWLIQDRSLVNE